VLNLHSLYHLPDCVREHGPLPLFSASPFEGALSGLKLQNHARRLAEKQLTLSANIISTMPEVQRQLEEEVELGEDDANVGF
jgi:hypothetical protein